MALVARLRSALARWPWIHWCIVVGCAGAVWWSVHQAQAAAHAAERRWGAQRTVWVSTADTPAGAPLHVEARRFPVSLLPHGAARTVPPTAVATRTVSAGAVVVSADLGTAHDAPAGWVVFALPADAAPSLRPGDTATVFGGGRRLCDGAVTAPATHADTGVSTVEVAVAPTCAPEVGQQLVAHSIVLARAVRSGT